MRQIQAVATSVLAGAVLVGGATVAAAPSSAAPPGGQLEVYVPESVPTHVDELEPGLGPGDWLLSRDPVLTADGEQIGTAVTRVQAVAHHDGDVAFVLDCTVEFADGRLVFTGAERLRNLTSTVRYAVAGGTGRYAGAEGQVEGTPATVDGRPASRMTFQLSKK